MSISTFKRAFEKCYGESQSNGFKTNAEHAHFDSSRTKKCLKFILSGIQIFLALFKLINRVRNYTKQDSKS
jgi:hypothetical protein